MHRQAEEAKGGKAKLALIGTGSRGMYHVNNLMQIPQAEVVAVCDIYPPHLENAAKQYPQAKVYTNYLDAIHDPNVEGVLTRHPRSCHAGCSSGWEACLLRKSDGPDNGGVQGGL